MNSDGDLSLDESSLFPSPVMFIGEEKIFSCEGKNIIVNKISKIFDSKLLTETPECFNQNFTRQFIALPGSRVIVCSVFEKRKFTAKKTNQCQKELENEKEARVIITVSWLSPEDNEIKCEPVCNTTLDLFKITTELSKYSYFVEKIVEEL
jgi:hypothetical protein